MCAYFIKLSTAVLGHSILAVRLPSVLAALATLLILMSLTPGRRYLTGLLCSPIITFGALVISPDTPLMISWAAYLAWLVHTHVRLDDPAAQRPRWWLGGVLLGLGMLSKYTMGLGLAAGFASFLLVRPCRSWLAGYALHLAIAFLAASPILIFNMQHNFAPLRFQWEHVMVGGPRTIAYFPEFVGVQMLLVGCAPFSLLPWVIWNRRELLADPRLRVCTCLYVLPLLFFLYKAARGPLEANWPLVAYLGFWPLAEHWLATSRWPVLARRLTMSSFLPPIGTSLFLAVHMAWPLPFVAPSKDRLTRDIAFAGFCRDVSAELRRLPGQPTIYMSTYQLTAMIRYQGVNGRQVPGWARNSQFTVQPQPLDQATTTWLLSENPLPPHLAAGYRQPILEAEFPFYAREQLQAKFNLWRYEPSAPAATEQARVAQPQ